MPCCARKHRPFCGAIHSSCGTGSWPRPAGCGFFPGTCPARSPTYPASPATTNACAPLLKRAIRLIAADTDLWFDDVWVTDSTPVECGRSRPTVKRSDLAGRAVCGYCSSHSRFFWGLRLHLICTPSGLPIAWSLADAKADERQGLTATLEADPNLLATRPDQLIIAHNGRSIEGVGAASPNACSP
jgi:hypothetical protein